jgi:DNA-binding Lrp family transcriptional regulator
MKAYPHKVDYMQVYKDIVKLKQNKEIYKAKIKVIKNKMPTTYQDIADKYNISKEEVSYIKKFIEKQR